MTAPYVSVLFPTRQPGPAIQAVLEAVYQQKVPFGFEVLVIDSGSSEAELALMRQFPIELDCIAPEAFGHGRTRNLLAARARGEVLVFMVQDAEPASSHWMASLVAPLEEPMVAGAYARQLPTANTSPLGRFFLSQMYGPEPARRVARGDGSVTLSDIFFSNVSSAIRRSVWQEVPFRTDVVMSEDQHWARDALRAGYEVRYEPSAAVYHCHEYTLLELFRRNRLSGASLAGLIADSPGGIARQGALWLAREAVFLARGGQIGKLPYAAAYELTRAAGFWLGSRGW